MATSERTYSPVVSQVSRQKAAKDEVGERSRDGDSNPGPAHYE